MKKKRNIFLVILILLFSLILTGCPDKEPKLTEEEKADIKLKEEFESQDLFLFFLDSDIDNVYYQFTLVQWFKEYEIFWESYNPEVLTINGNMAIPTLGEEDKEVTLKATALIRDGFYLEREIKVTVKKERPFIFHEITLDLNGGDYNGRVQHVVQETMRLHNIGIPEKAGHDFIGWLKDGQPFDLDERISSSFTLVAQYKKQDIPQKIVYLDLGKGRFLGGEKKSYIVENGALFTQPPNPFGGGAFDGWFLNDQPFDFNTPITEDITLVAKYTPQHRVLILLDGGTLGDMKQQTDLIYREGALIENPGEPEKYGYIFTGWYSHKLGKMHDFNKPVITEVILVAKYAFDPMPIFEEIKTNIINNHSNEIYTHGETINLLRTYNFDNNYFSIKYTTDPQGLIDNSGKVVGTHVGPVTVTAKIEFGTLVQKIQFPITIKGSVVPPSDYGTYYDSLTATSGDALVSQLQTLITGSLGVNGEGNVSYGEVRYLLENTDKNLYELNRLWGIYDGASLPGAWDYGHSWDREHVWPQSRLNSRADNSLRNIASDPHNIRACTPSVNQSRSNKIFVQGNGPNKSIGQGYFPGDQHKGDVARILLYMAVRYRGILTLVDVQSGSNNTPQGANFAMLSILLDWHLTDAPDQFERQRNNAIQNAQGNRNPFIDKPYLFEPVWEVLMESAGLSVQKTAAFNQTINTYDKLKTIYIPSEIRYII